jgi:hypothetical protein
MPVNCYPKCLCSPWPYRIDINDVVPRVLFQRFSDRPPRRVVGGDDLELIAPECAREISWAGWRFAVWMSWPVKGDLEDGEGVQIIHDRHRS